MADFDKGAFPRFKDELCEEHPDLLPAWYAFRNTRASRRAVQWLADNSLIDDGSANSFFPATRILPCLTPVHTATGALSCRMALGLRASRNLRP